MSAIPQDQAAELRLLVASQSRRPEPVTRHAPSARVIAIASGKGGVGKTNLAVNLAIRLARIGRRVLLVDADLGTANCDCLLNLHAPYNLSHCLQGQRRLDQIVVRLDPHLRIIVGASGLSAVADLSTFDRGMLIDDLARFEHQCDIILLDCGAGISQNVLAFAHAADELLIVTTPEPTALTDAYALAKSITLSSQPHQPEAPARPTSSTPPSMHLIVNQAATPQEARRVADRIAAVAAKYLHAPLDCIAQIPAVPHLPLAVRSRCPLVIKYPRSPAARSISALATRLATPAKSPSRHAPFFRRLLDFFTESPADLRRCQS